MKAKVLRAGIALLLLSISFSAWQAVGAQATNGSQWNKLGSVPQGTRGIYLDYVNPSIVYALGSTGISRSTDNGTSWTPCSADARSLTVVAPQQSQTDTVTLYASTPAGLRQSTDSCQTWKDVPTQAVLPSGGHIRWLAPYPNNPQVLYAGMDGLGGLYRSTDGGANWQGASSGLPAGAWTTALTADPQNPSRIFIGLRYATNNHPPAYIYRSTDGGLTWRSASMGLNLLPNNGGQITGLTWSGGTLFAATATDGLYFSDDSGTSWKEALLPRRTDLGSTQTSPNVPSVKLLPIKVRSIQSTNDGALFINTSEGAFQSLDSGRTWQHFGPDSARGDGLLLAVESISGRALLAASDGLWSYTMPTGAVALPSPTAITVAQVPPTPPPPVHLPTNTPPVPTATTKPLPTATPTVVLATGPLPTDRAQPMDPTVSDYFPETGHNISYGFRDYWKSNGGLAKLGYPLTEEFVENGVTVQYFERVRLEYRDGAITWGLLGTELTQGQFFQTVRFFPSTDDNVYFGPTQHSVSGPFLRFWQNGGGLNTFGYPLSESFKNDDGSEYQWFERARFEYHPDSQIEGEPVVIQLGNIGTEALRKKGWLR